MEQIKKEKPAKEKKEKQPKIEKVVRYNERINLPDGRVEVWDKDGKRSVYRLDAPVYLTSESYKIKMDLYQRKKWNYKIIQDGSLTILDTGYGKFCNRETVADGIGKGFHLSKLVKNDVRNYLKKRKGEIPLYGSDYLEQGINVEGIRNALGRNSISIDVNDCYWRTAYLLGYITKETYVMGKRKNDWKVGRNASIGSLMKVIVIRNYVNGVLDPATSKRISPDAAFVNVRNHIIGTVYQMFEELRAMLGNSFYMFLTDCVFTDALNINRVKKFFREKMYECKVDAVEFTELDLKVKTVKWTKFAKDPLTEKHKKKYYMYSDQQVIYGEIKKELTILDKGNIFRVDDTQDDGYSGAMEWNWTDEDKAGLVEFKNEP
jgi:hypothetical protein